MNNIHLTHIAFRRQRKENLKKWESIEGSKPEYRNRLVFTTDQLIQIEIDYTKRFGYEYEQEYANKLERWEKQRIYASLINESKPIIKKIPKKEKRQRVKTGIIKIPIPDHQGQKNKREERNQKNENRIPIEKDNWQNFWKDVN